MRELWIAVALLGLLTACWPDEERSAPPPVAAASPEASAETGCSSGGELRRVGGVDIVAVGCLVPPDARPYPFLTPAPPSVSTPIDGAYLRILTFDQLGGPPGAFPIRCLRCPPFLPHAGVSTLIFHEGNYWLNHQLSGFRSMGHFTIDGHTITVFNDPHCPQDLGRYRWKMGGGAVRFEFLGGECPYERTRARDFTMVPWTRIDPCIFRFEHLWPAPRVGC